MDQERDSGLMSAPEAELLHTITRLRCELQLAQARAYALEVELQHARGKLHAYSVLVPARGQA